MTIEADPRVWRALEAKHASGPDDEDRILEAARRIVGALQPEVIARLIEAHGKVGTEGTVEVKFGIRGETDLDVLHAAARRVPRSVVRAIGNPSVFATLGEVYVVWSGVRFPPGLRRPAAPEAALEAAGAGAGAAGAGTGRRRRWTYCFGG